MEKIDVENMDIQAHRQMKTLEQYLNRFNKTNYKATPYEMFMLGSMLNKLTRVIDNCLFALALTEGKE